MRTSRNIAYPGITLRPFSREIRDIFNSVLNDCCQPVESSQVKTFVPKINVEQHPKGMKVSLDVPGLSEKDLDIQVIDEQLVVSGERVKDFEEQKENTYYLERTYGSFKRSLALGKEYDADKVSAALSAGVLTIDIPKKAEASERARKIEICNC